MMNCGGSFYDDRTLVKQQSMVSFSTTSGDTFQPVEPVQHRPVGGQCEQRAVAQSAGPEFGAPSDHANDRAVEQPRRDGSGRRSHTSALSDSCTDVSPIP